MKKVLDIFKKPLWLLCLGLGIVLFASIFANMANTSLYQVSVTNVTFETEHGEMAGLLYRPRKCTAKNPCATIVTTHGYLNTGEMQDAPAIELSKRGYVVLAMDMYDHGDSTWDSSEYGEFMFFKWSQYDAVQWAYKQDFVLKASDGTGMIAVSGHSMGGFSSRVAAYFDSQDVENGEPQKIAAVLAVGADFTYVPRGTGASTDTVIAADAAQKRTMGTIAARYDEFFFNADGNKGGTVKEKDYTSTTEGTKFYYAEDYTGSNEEFESAQWNTESYNGGGSVIYVPNEIHPLNHFSTETTGYMIDFYDTAFETQIKLHNVTENEGVVSYKDGTAQSWWLKEGFECIGLIGMFVSIIAAIALFAQLPFFGKVVTAEGEINAVGAPTGARKWIMRGFLVLSCAATAYIYPMIQLGTTDAFVESVKAIMWACALILVAGLVAKYVVKAVKGEDEHADKVFNTLLSGALIVFAASFFSYWTLTKTFFGDSNYWNEPTTNQIAYWILVVSGLTVIALSISHFLSNKQDGYTYANYGLKANWKQILIGLLIAVIVVTGVYALTFAIEALLRVDFRVWTYAIKPFNKHSFVAFLKYLPVYFLFFLTVGLNVVANTGSDKSWKGTLKAVLISALPTLILVGVHYGMDFATATAKWPTLALNMILVIVIPITMGFAAWIIRKSWQKTGNLWTGVFICTLLFTMIQVANTTLYLMQ